MRLIADDAVAIATVYGEARGESDDGMTCVAETIRNRIRAGRGKDATAVCLAPLQFSCWNHDTRWRAAMLSLDVDDPVAQRCAAAWALAQAGSDVARGATAYLNVEETRRLRGDGTLPFWARDPTDPTRINERLVTVRMGAHVFLRA